MNGYRSVTVLSFVILLVACSGRLAATEPGDEAKTRAAELRLESIPEIAGDVSVSKKEPVDAKVPGPGMQELVDAAIRDLAGHLDLEPSAITVLSAESVTWRDSSLGCPTPGNEYLQVLTRGSRIRLEAKGQVFHYHGGGKRAPFLCRNPSEPAPSPYGPDAS